MPCTYYGPGERESEELDRVTRLLCRMVAKFGVIEGDEELAKWKAEHDAMDQRREQALRVKRNHEQEAELESLRRTALARLTPAEREALDRWARGK